MFTSIYSEEIYDRLRQHAHVLARSVVLNNWPHSDSVLSLVSDCESIFVFFIVSRMILIQMKIELYSSNELQYFILFLAIILGLVPKHFLKTEFF